MKFLASAIFCLILLGTSLLYSADYYVATNGFDIHPGTESQPWRTIQRAADTLVAGDTVYIRNGTYVEEVVPLNSGSEGSYITYRSYPGETAIIESPDQTPSGFCMALLDDRDLHHMRFTDLTLRAAGGAPFYAGATASGPKHNLILDGLTVEDGYLGIYFEDGVTDSKIINCELHRNQYNLYLARNNRNILIKGNHISYSQEFHAGSFWSNNLEIHGEPGQENRGIVISNNHIHHAAMQGIEVWHSHNVLVRNNYSHHNGATGIQIESAGGSQVSERIVVEGNLCEHNNQTYPSETGIWVDDSAQVIVQKNICRYNEIGLMITGSSQVIARFNTLYENHEDVFNNAVGTFVRGSPNGFEGTDNILVHNTLYRNSLNSQRAQVVVGLWSWDPAIEQAVFKNNISSYSLADFDLWTQGLTNTLDYNTYYHPSRPLAVVWQETAYNWATYLSLSGQDSHSLTSDPQFFDPENGNFALRSSSLCKDAGAFLTTTTLAGSGTMIAVQDARYFSGGMGVIQGDRIQVGTNPIAMVVYVNYSSNLVGVDRSLVWNAGDPVSYPYYGTAPDMGALEFLGPDRASDVLLDFVDPLHQ